MPQNTFLAKMLQIYLFIFLPRTLLGRLTAAVHGSGVPPLQKECPLQDKFLAMRAYGPETLPIVKERSQVK